MVFGLFVSNTIHSMITFESTLNYVMAPEEGGECDCEFDQNANGRVGEGCTDFYENTGSFVYKCCSSEGAFPEEWCDCSIECNTPYNPDPCPEPE